MEYLTVGQLREFLKELPDDMQVNIGMHMTYTTATKVAATKVAMDTDYHPTDPFPAEGGSNLVPVVLIMDKDDTE